MKGLPGPHISPCCGLAELVDKKAGRSKRAKIQRPLCLEVVQRHFLIPLSSSDGGATTDTLPRGMNTGRKILQPFV